MMQFSNNSGNTAIRPRSVGLILGLIIAALSIALSSILLFQLINVPGVKASSFLEVFNNSRIVKTFIVTLFQAGLSTFLSIAVGGLLAWSLAAQSDFQFRNLLISLVSSALVLPTLVVILGIVSIYGRNGWITEAIRSVGGEGLPFSIYGLGGILIAHVFFNASFSARILLLRLEAIPDEKRKLALSLNLSLWRSLRCIEFPAISAIIPSLAVTIFLLCFTSFSIVLTLAGSPAFNTLEVAIYEAVKFEFDLHKAFQLSLIQLVFGAILVLSFGKLSSDLNIMYSRSADFPYKNYQALSVNFTQVAIITIFMVFFLLPLIAVTYDGFGMPLIGLFSTPVFWKSLTTSVLIAISSTAIVLVTASMIAQAISTLNTNGNWRGSRLASALSSVLSFSAMMYLVIPALVMGLGFFLLFLNLGADIAWWAGVVVILANAMIAMPFAVASLQPALTKCAIAHDRLSQSLKLTPSNQFWLVDWPMLKKDYYYVAALAFSFSLGDLGVIALFGNNDFQTLPWLLFQKFGTYQTQDASAIALVLFALVAFVFASSNRFSNADNREQKTEGAK